MGIMRWKTPLIYQFDQFSYVIERIERAVSKLEWFAANAYEIHTKLKGVEPNLAAELFGVLEGHHSPYGLTGLDYEGMSLCRAVDSFQCILVTFIGEVFKKKPETMLAIASGPVEISWVLSCATLDEFRERVASRKLRQLGKFSQVRSFIKKLGVDVVVDPETERVVTNAIALRNIRVHNSGRVDDEFLQRTRRTDVQVGDAVGITKEILLEALRALRVTVDAFQMALGDKFFGLGESLVCGDN